MRNIFKRGARCAIGSESGNMKSCRTKTYEMSLPPTFISRRARQYLTMTKGETLIPEGFSVSKSTVVGISVTRSFHVLTNPGLCALQIHTSLMVESRRFIE